MRRWLNQKVNSFLARRRLKKQQMQSARFVPTERFAILSGEIKRLHLRLPENGQGVLRRLNDNDLSQIIAVCFPDSHPQQISKPLTPETWKNRQWMLEGAVSFFERQLNGEPPVPLDKPGVSYSDPLHSYVLEFVKRKRV